MLSVRCLTSAWPMPACRLFRNQPHQMDTTCRSRRRMCPHSAGPGKCIKHAWGRVQSHLIHNLHTTMRTTFTTAFILAFFGQAALCTPLAGLKPTTIGATFPVQDLSSGGARPNTTLSHGGRIHADITPADFPAAFLMCTTPNCISCFAQDLSTIPHNECLVNSFDMLSIAISQPSNVGLDFGCFVGSTGCGILDQIAAVNTCYNINSSVPFTNFALA
ncbi:hypothetical protein C2E23DRAFT_209365 [Lenzites betulinus]|nr:hypothetical protein C2E23DRAFT_209365 [Lenzites betulinus]